MSGKRYSIDYRTGHLREVEVPLKREHIPTITNLTQDKLGLEMFALAGMVSSVETVVDEIHRRGQSEMVHQRTQLPAKFDGKEALEKFGVKFGDPVKGDSLFVQAELPKGWSIQSLGHPLWTKLVDEKGRKRATIFYNAAFYDRAAHGSAVRRFSSHYSYDENETFITPQIRDGDEIIWSGEPIPANRQKESEAYHAACERAHKGESTYEEAELCWAHRKAGKIARDELARRFPNFEDMTAYWE